MQSFVSLHKTCPKCQKELGRLAKRALLFHGLAECDRCGTSVRYNRKVGMTIAAVVGGVFGVASQALSELGIIEAALIGGLTFFVLQRFVDFLFDDLEICPGASR